MTCKNCKHYSAPDGSEGRWMVCANPKMKVANAYDNYNDVGIDGIGNSNRCLTTWDDELYVGSEFGCIHFEKK